MYGILTNIKKQLNGEYTAMDKNSQSYRRMDKLIMNAFIEITQKIPFEKLTVTDITEAAMISRYTFYVHFHDKYEVAERLLDECYHSFTEFMEERLPAIRRTDKSSVQQRQMTSQALIEFGEKYHAQSKVLLNIHTENIDFMKRIKQYFIDKYKKQLPDHENVELEAMIYANVIMAVSEYFNVTHTSLGDGQKISSSYIYALLYALGVHEEQKLKELYAYLLRFVEQ